MQKEQFETHIKETIDPGLYLEDAISKNGVHYTDIDRIMYAKDGKNYYICAFPKQGVQEEFNPGYRSDNDQAFPNREMVEAKIKTFLSTLETDIKDGLYD